MKKDESESGTMILVTLAGAVVMAPIHALIATWVFSKYWSLFLAGFGPGPTQQQWFGISAMVSMAIGLCLVGVKRDDDFNKNHQILMRSILVPIGMLLALLVSYGTALILGWA